MRNCPTPRIYSAPVNTLIATHVNIRVGNGIRYTVTVTINGIFDGNGGTKI